MFSRIENSKNDEELTLCSEQTQRSRSLTTIDNYNINTEKVILLDISSNKEWMACVTRNHVDESLVYLTVRKLIAVCADDREDRISIKDGSQVITTEDFHLSLYINDLMKDKLDCCKFLSISGDGKYIALSFYYSTSTIKDREETECYIFEVKDNFIDHTRSVNFNGRAVFLNEKNPSLLLVDADSIRYSDFLGTPFKDVVFDLDIFVPGIEPVLPNFDDSYIKGSPWLDIPEETDEIKKLVTFTRCIRQNILTTPFDAIRIWSLSEKCILLSSIGAKEQHITAFSKITEIVDINSGSGVSSTDRGSVTSTAVDSEINNAVAANNEIGNNKFAASYSKNHKEVNVYNVKNGLLIYSFKIRRENQNNSFRISHMCFCFENRYLAITGCEGNNVIFEVWYLDSGKSIHKTSRNTGDSYDNLIKLKVFEPFILQKRNPDGDISLAGFYMSKDGHQLKINFVDLKINTDTAPNNIRWETITNPSFKCNKEIDDSLLDYQNLKCGYINIGEEDYLIRFGIYTVQLWKVGPNTKLGDSINHEDKLIYIRAYKGPFYGHEYSFRETWRICDYKSIKFTEGKLSHRLTVNITGAKVGCCNCKSDSKRCHREEIFLMPGETRNEKISEIHRFESACQALHYLYKTKGHTNEENIIQLRNKTQEIIKSDLNSIGVESKYFIGIAGNRTLAMLASFEEGRKIIASIISRPVPISICSYSRPQSEIKKIDPKEVGEAITHLRLVFLELKTFFRKKAEHIEKKFTTERSKKVTAKISLFMRRIANILYRNAVNQCDNLKIVGETDTIAKNENVLTVLMEKLSYDLFKLLFNRVLSDSQILGTGGLSALTDVVLFLQEADSDLLLPTIKKLAYLRIGEDKLEILQSEFSAYKDSYSFYYEDNVKLVNLEPHAIREELKMYTAAKWSILKRAKAPKVANWLKILRSLKHFIWHYLTGNPKGESTKSLRVCIIPLQYFNLYDDAYGRSFIADSKKREKNINQQSSFIQMALNRRSNTIFKQGDTIFEISLEYKWKEFARKKFILICFINSLYYISYSTGVLFSRVLYVKGPGNEFDMSHPGHIISLIIMGASFIVLLIQEIRQFLITTYKVHYLLSYYNWVDLAAFIFPAYTVFQSLLGWDHFSEICSFTALILWVHGVLRLRVISYFGVTLEIVIELLKKVFSTLCIMFLGVIAFTMSFIVLLTLEKNSFFQENYSGSFTGTIGKGAVDFVDVSADNGFINWFTAFSKVWLFIYGVWDPITQGEAGNSKMVKVLCILYSCSMALIFFNIIIALMSNAVGEVQKLGKKAWVGHFAAVISEIELLWCSKTEQNDRKNNPSHIYYVAKEETIRNQEEELLRETNELLGKLNIRLDAPQTIRY